MSPPGRPKGRHRTAQREGFAMSLLERPRAAGTLRAAADAGLAPGRRAAQR